MNGILRHILAEIALAVPLALILRRYVVMLAYVKGRSMLDTLENRELVYARPVLKRTKIRRFDIVLCRYPNRKELFIKRIVAFPGERVALADGVLRINGEAVPEEFPLRRTMRPFEEKQLGEDEYFVIGDNRLSSRDSRSVGAIPRSMLVARAAGVIFPFGKIRRLR